MWSLVRQPHLRRDVSGVEDSDKGTVSGAETSRIETYMQRWARWVRSGLAGSGSGVGVGSTTRHIE